MGEGREERLGRIAADPWTNGGSFDMKPCGRRASADQILELRT